MMPAIPPESMPHGRFARSGPLGRFASAALAAGAAFTLGVSGFSATFNTARFGVTLAVLLTVHLIRIPKIVFGREAALYSAFIGYLLIALLWTDDIPLAFNTILPAVNFLIALMLFGSLAALHDFRAVLAGLLCGFLAAAVLYTMWSGFPFSYPAEFSYNAIAGMYLFGLFVALLSLTFARLNAPYLAIAAVLMSLMVATTSIKTNLGIAAGAVAAGFFHLRQVGRMARRNALLLIVMAGILFYAIATNEIVTRSLERGFHRVSLGIEILQARENLQGYTSFEKRMLWMRDGLAGWAQNPLFGEGVEAFRSRFGLTSHSTAIDLLYNTGIIGFLLFYGVIASVLWRLHQTRHVAASGVRALVLGAMVCSLFISLSGNVHYGAVLAAIVALSVATLKMQGGVETELRA